MLHLLQQTVSPFLSLAAACRDWLPISQQLQEAPRQRLNQLSRLSAFYLSAYGLQPWEQHRQEIALKGRPNPECYKAS